MQRELLAIELSPEQKLRYSRQLALPGMNEDAQVRLLAGIVLIVGASKSTVSALSNLSLAGVGTITVVDDVFARVDALKDVISRMPNFNPDVQLIYLSREVGSVEIEEEIENADVVLDGLKDWQQKLTLSDACMQLAKPLVHLGEEPSRFQIFTMQPGKSACLRCAFPKVGMDDIPFGVREAGELDALTSAAGALQALETIKLIGKLGVSQGNELVKFDCVSGEFEIFRGLDPSPDCPDCGRFGKQQMF